MEIHGKKWQWQQKNKVMKIAQKIDMTKENCATKNRRFEKSFGWIKRYFYKDNIK